MLSWVLTVSHHPRRPIPDSRSLPNLCVLRASALEASFLPFTNIPTCEPPNSFGILSFADPHPLTPLESYRFKNIGGWGRALICDSCNSPKKNAKNKPSIIITLRTLPFSVGCKSFVCHSYENCRVYTNSSQFGTRPPSLEPQHHPHAPASRRANSFLFLHYSLLTTHYPLSSLSQSQSKLRNPNSLPLLASAAICYDSHMRKAAIFTISAALCVLSLASPSLAQTDRGTLDFAARIAPTAARPEPVRQFTFFILTKSYTEIVKEVEDKDAIPPRDAFIDTLKVSPEMRAWLKAHDIFVLTLPGVDKAMTPDDILHTPEFLLAYQRSNSGGVTNGIPKPKYADADKTDHPEKYQKQMQEYMTALKKFIQAHPETVSGIELELDGVNPQRKWAAIQNDRRKRVQRDAPDTAQTKYLVAKADSDLDGHASVSGLAPGNYWISSLNLDAAAGDMRLRWDVPVTIEPGKTTRIELTNLNSTDAHGSNP